MTLVDFAKACIDLIDFKSLESSESKLMIRFSIIFSLKLVKHATNFLELILTKKTKTSKILKISFLHLLVFAL